MNASTIKNVWNDSTDEEDDFMTSVITNTDTEDSDDVGTNTKKSPKFSKKQLTEEHKAKMFEGRRRYWEQKRAAAAAAEEEVVAPRAKRRKVEFAEPISETKLIRSEVDDIERTHIDEINAYKSTISKQEIYISNYNNLLAQRDSIIKMKDEQIERYRHTIVHLQAIVKEQYQAIGYNKLAYNQDKDMIARQQQIIAGQHSLILTLSTRGQVAALESGLAAESASSR
jgi:hypothetical protein